MGQRRARRRGPRAWPALLAHRRQPARLQYGRRLSARPADRAPRACAAGACAAARDAGRCLIDAAPRGRHGARMTTRTTLSTAEAILNLEQVDERRFRSTFNQDNYLGMIFGGQPLG